MAFAFTLKPDHSLERHVSLTRPAEASALGRLALFDALGLIDEEFRGTLPGLPEREVLA